MMEDFKEKLSDAYFGGDYDSEFEFDTGSSKKRKAHDDVVFKPPKIHVSKPKKQDFVEESCKEQGRIQKLNFLAKDAYTRHKELINQYILCYRGTTSYLKRDRSKDKTDHDVIKENHQFLWDDEDDDPNTWEKQLAKKYYDKLFKEYCLADLSRYKENKIAMRWRTELEVIEGKGQFSCGHIRCNNKEELRSWEVNFGYVEHNVKKNALVKIRLCPKCSYKLNYHHKRKEITKSKEPDTSQEHSDDNLNTSEVPVNEEHICDQGSTDNAAESGSNIESSSEKKSSDSANCDIWKQPISEEIETTKSRDDDFEQYLADMLL